MEQYDQCRLSTKPDLNASHPYLTHQVSNCSSEEEADRCTAAFLYKFNKHDNRVQLVHTICGRLHNKNNLLYMLRVLKGVSLSEHQEITQIMTDWYAATRQKVDRYAGVWVELIKFGLLDGRIVMKHVLEAIGTDLLGCFELGCVPYFQEHLGGQEEGRSEETDCLTI